MTTPTQRSLKMLRDAGYTVAVVERWNPHAKIRQDLFGFADLLAISTDEILLVQTTTAANMAARRAKILAAPCFILWIEAGGEVVLHGWRKNKNRWECLEETLDADS